MKEYINSLSFKNITANPSIPHSLQTPTLSMEAALPQRVSSKSPHTTAIKITSWNCRGLCSGVAYAELLADDTDVILSEDWLSPFDTDKFNSIFTHKCWVQLYATAD